MSASHPTADRPRPMVAIVGTDAVLAAAPATPVQLAHACLRRGFAVAVPASWGDELIAAETLRRLATKERGPAVMCVCPFARARLLAPGPDLARFLVSLVSPPVAAARYIRSAYGSQGVHITYIGACPGADDSSIDARLTPDAFITDLAEHGIALSEQPLVFDSIVPPDRRRWCSLPGGIPNAEALGAEVDARAVIEMDRDDVTTELAQHILAREHVLLDLAPSLGCACSGAVGAIAPNRARSTAMAAEPPRAFSPVIDPATPVSLDVPVAEPASPRLMAPAITAPATSVVTLERVLDELLGSGPLTAEPATEWSTTVSSGAIILDLPELPPIPIGISNTVAAESSLASGETARDRETVSVDYQSAEENASEVIDPEISEPETSEPETLPTETDELEVMPTEIVAVSPGLAEDSTVAERAATVLGAEAMEMMEEPVPTLGVVDLPQVPSSPAEENGGDLSPVPPVTSDDDLTESTVAHASNGAADSLVRRRTPPAAPRYLTSSVPKATVANGRPLPRAYVAKRRTPPGGGAVIGPAAASVSTPAVPIAPESTRPDELVVPAPVAIEPDAETPAASTEMADPATSATAASAASTPQADRATAHSRAGASGAAARSASHPALMFLLVTALVALAAFVLLTLR